MKDSDELDSILEILHNSWLEDDYDPSDPSAIEARQALAAYFEEMAGEGLTVAGKKIKFSHTAVNGDMHLFIDGYHDPDVCPECIQPGILVEQRAQLQREDERV